MVNKSLFYYKMLKIVNAFQRSPDSTKSSVTHQIQKITSCEKRRALIINY